MNAGLKIQDDIQKYGDDDGGGDIKIVKIQEIADVFREGIFILDNFVGDGAAVKDGKDFRFFQP